MRERFRDFFVVHLVLQSVFLGLGESDLHGFVSGQEVLPGRLDLLGVLDLDREVFGLRLETDLGVGPAIMIENG